MPANIATLDQPKATTNVALAPPKQKANLRSRPQIAPTEKSPSPQPRPSAVEPKPEPKNFSPDCDSHGVGAHQAKCKFKPSLYTCTGRLIIVFKRGFEMHRAETVRFNLGKNIIVMIRSGKL